MADEDMAGEASDAARRAGESMLAGGRRIAEQGSAFSAKLIDQAEANASQAFQAMRAAAQARDVGEVMRIKGDFLREQSARSVAQAREIGELIAQFGRDAISAMRGGEG